jgi:membrane-associated protease RseP (regulator of RpoE activity)
MCCASSDDYFADPVGMPPFEQVQAMVKAEFDVEESFVDHNIPTFHVRYREESKEAFLRLMEHLEPLQLIPILRKKDETVVLRVMAKPPIKPNRNIINLVLFFATLGTVFLSGYILSDADIIGALMFTGAIMAILGSHEMGHKLLADKHDVDATYPYFIPSPPPPFGIGTFGAVIRQKAIPPNRDALFDIGFTGPITGFILAVIVTIIGVQISAVVPYDPSMEVTPIADVYPLIYRWIFQIFSPSSSGVILRHPVAFAGWVGMVVTMLNLVPSGMFDGGHIARSVMGDKAHQIISYAGIILLVLIGWWTMAVLALFFSATRHPGPLDDVSEITNSRKLGAIVLVAVFILSAVPLELAF